MYTYMCVCGKSQECCKVRLDKITTTTTTTENGTGSEDAEQGAGHHSRNYVWTQQPARQAQAGLSDNDSMNEGPLISKLKKLCVDSIIRT